MKNSLLILMFFSVTGFAQIQTTTGSGNFFNPLLWDCLCVPASGDSLVVNHNMQLTASIYYNAGQIKVNPSGSLIEDAMDRDVWVDGTGSLINNGTFDCYRLYVSDGSFINTSTSVYFDSLWNQGSIANSGVMTVYDVLNDQAGSFTNSGTFVIDNNFNNQGEFLNSATGTIDLGNDFSNCNIQTMDAMFVNDGVFCIAMDFTNCIDDTLNGSGEYFIGGASSNFGVFDGSFTFNTPSGSVGVPGNIQAGVTVSNQPCYLALEENISELSVYPNPAKDLIFVSEINLIYQITDLSGKIICTGRTSSIGVDISTFESGVYTIQIQTEAGTISNSKFVKL
jgi:hypothetical protein